MAALVDWEKVVQGILNRVYANYTTTTVGYPNVPLDTANLTSWVEVHVLGEAREVTRATAHRSRGRFVANCFARMDYRAGSVNVSKHHELADAMVDVMEHAAIAVTGGHVRMLEADPPVDVPPRADDASLAQCYLSIPFLVEAVS